jgi:glycosidase
MKKTVVLVLLLSLSLVLGAAEITRIEPSCWWVGMKNPELQLLVYGKNIGRAEVQVEYPGVRLRTMVPADSPDYLFLYLDIDPGTSPGFLNLTFRTGKKRIVRSFELKPRSSSPGAQGFTSADVLYLIMPDRFANGDPSNDHWDREAVDRTDPSARHGGDLAGIRQHLDYLDDLGVTALWLNPVLENKMNGPDGYQSYHGYAITDFYRVDRRLGSNEDYRLLIEDLHRRGMKIVMDMIYNHCGSRHPWMGNLPFRDWLNHPDGFVETSHNLYAVMDPHAPPSEVQALTDGWFVPSMPDLNQRNPHLATYLIQNSIWWIEYARLDGIRHDTHPYADFDFLARWCATVFDEYPDFNIVGESWYPQPAPLAWWQAASAVNPRPTHLKTVMDFALRTAAHRSFSMDSPVDNPLQILHQTLACDFLYADSDRLLVFLDNHDTDRFFQAGESDLRRFKQALAFLLTTRGIPQLYYGTEWLMSGEKKDGDGALRQDFPGGWPDDPHNAFRPDGRDSLQNEAHRYLRQLLQWRKTHPAVDGGVLLHYAPSTSSPCYVYARIKDDHRLLVFLNGSDQEQTLSLQPYSEVIADAAFGKEILSGRILDMEAPLAIPARGAYIIELFHLPPSMPHP